MRKCRLIIGLLLIIMIVSVQVSAADLPPDGQYMIEVTLSGGSGRAQVASPTILTVTNGATTAVVQWSSPYYETMLVDGVAYSPINTDGNSKFEIPVMPDIDMAVTARTVAMSRPHEIDYTLRFDCATIKPLSSEKTMLTPLGTAAITAAFFLSAAAGLIIFASKRRANGYKTAEGKQGFKE